MSNKNNKHYHNHNKYNHHQSNNQHNNHNETKKNFDQHDNINNEPKKEQVLTEVDQLKKEINELKAKLILLDEQNFKYKSEISKLNSDYIQKIMQKSAEAQELIKEKQNELEEKFKTKLDEQIINYVEKKFSSFLDSINQLNRIINLSDNTSNEVKNYLIGFKMILDLFHHALSDLNIKIIEINVGDEFDEKYMSAFEAVHVDNVKQNSVVEVISPAYQFMGKIIKHGLVKVQK